ncbi:MAG: hypothetical protein HS111_17690 [Kofleriaceae bacterium]|nr:hypothetical protein [Kofleriaceae bacterium]
MIVPPVLVTSRPAGELAIAAYGVGVIVMCGALAWRLSQRQRALRARSSSSRPGTSASSCRRRRRWAWSAPRAAAAVTPGHRRAASCLWVYCPS